jgi:hypothetical protein
VAWISDFGEHVAYATSPIHVDPLFLCATGGHGTYRSSRAAAKLEELALITDLGETFCIAGLLKACLRRLTATVTFA